MNNGKCGMKGVAWGRRIAGCLVLAAFITLFLGLEWRFVSWIAPIAKVQFMPAMLALNFIVAGAILVVTFLVGRIYCSVLCPLGLLQDVGGRLGRFARWIFRRPSRGTAASSRVQVIVRYTVLAAFFAVGLCGLGFSWIEPYGIFGRAFVAWPALVLVSFIFLIAVFGRGRDWCGWICPVGTFLGLVSKLSPFRIRIDGGRCIGCRKCERGCKTGAISIEGHGGKVDTSLCVDCFGCMAECPVGAIGFGRKCKDVDAEETTKPVDGVTRKGFIAGTTATGVAVAAQAADDKIFDGGFADITPPGIDVRNASLKPAGSHSIANFASRCVGCQLCVKACPNHVLRPSTRLKDFMQPEMAFDKGYCTVDCTRCADVCPAGAIAPLKGIKKKDIHIGQAVWHKDRCLAETEGVTCTACERHCPVKAITLVKTDGGNMVPVVDEMKCIGCGACEHVCPARPMPAMTVKAFELHREVRPKNSADVLAEAMELQAECGPDTVQWFRPMDS